MFASNQKLVITGDLKHQNDLENALKFVLHKGYDDVCNPKYKYPDAFQITSDGKYVLGRTYGEKKEGWISYPFETTIDILAPIIRQHLLKQEFPPCNEGDGGEADGYLITNVNCKQYSSEEVVNSWYAIITIEPYTCYYAK